MFDFSNTMVLVGGLCLILFPVILKMKRPFRLVFIFCGLGAIAVSFLDDVIQLDSLAAIFLIFPFLVAWIKRNDMFQKK